LGGGDVAAASAPTAAPAAAAAAAAPAPTHAAVSRPGTTRMLVLMCPMCAATPHGRWTVFKAWTICTSVVNTDRERESTHPQQTCVTCVARMRKATET
jgi:hypothetical protein